MIIFFYTKEINKILKIFSNSYGKNIVIRPSKLDNTLYSVDLPILDQNLDNISVNVKFNLSKNRVILSDGLAVYSLLESIDNKEIRKKASLKFREIFNKFNIDDTFRQSEDEIYFEFNINKNVGKKIVYFVNMIMNIIIALEQFRKF